MQEWADLEMKASSDDARVTWRWAFQDNPWAQSPDSLGRVLGNGQQVLFFPNQVCLRTLPSIS